MAGERRIVLGDYDTFADGQWILASRSFSEPAYKDNFVSVPGHSGDLDLSTTLTDGEPVYNNRTLTITLESSEGTRLERKARIDAMINLLDGRQMQIVLPDEDTCYVYGRVHVAQNYNDPAISGVTVTANCEPWRYAKVLTTQTITATSAATVYTLTNAGRRIAVPTLVVAGTNVIVAQGTYSKALSAGTCILPDITVPAGGAQITVSGSGTLTVSYREASL
jgi:hypothetical protein